MSFALLLLPAVGGYWFLTNWNYSRYQVVRDSGYRLLFKSALVGILLYCSAQVITLALDFLCPLITVVWDAHFPDPYTSEVAVSLALALVLPPLFNCRLGFPYTKLRGARRVASNAGDHIELLIDRAIEDREAIEVSLRSRKTYIGVAVESGIGAGADTDLALIPLLSGYRKEDTLELVVTTNYFDIISEYTGQSSGRTMRDLRVVIPLTEVMSARLFDMELYRAFQQRAAEES